jgi:hypothetical protein
MCTALSIFWWAAALRRRLLACFAVAGCALLAWAGSATASVSAPNAVSHRVGLAGYHFRVSGTSRLHVRGTFTVPTSRCGKAARHYQLQIGAGFRSGSNREDAIVVVALRCKDGVQGTGSAQLVAGHYAVDPATPIKAGERLTIAVTVERDRSAARLGLPGGKSDYLSGPGGTPDGGDYALTISSPRPPHFSIVTFSNCTVNRLDLSTFHPRAWKSVTSSGKVDGRVSPLSDGTSFTISS